MIYNRERNGSIFAIKRKKITVTVFYNTIIISIIISESEYLYKQKK